MLSCEHFVDDKLLHQRADIIHTPIKRESCGKPQKKESENHGQKLHNLRLCRVLDAHRRDELLHKHSRAHQNRQHKIRVHHAQIIYPQRPRRSF